MHFSPSGLMACAGGTYGLLAALGIFRISKNPDANEAWVRKFGPWLKILSPFVILYGLAELIGLFN